MTEETNKVVALTNGMSEIEARYTTLNDVLEKEKINHKLACEKLSKEEANHIITKQMLEEEKNCVDKIQSELDSEKLVVSEVSLGN